MPNNWEERQRKSDSSAERVAKHRERDQGRNVTSPLQKRFSNGVDIEKRREEKKTPLPPTGGDEGFHAFWTQYPRVLNNSKAKALRVWRRLEPEEREAAMAGLGKYCASDGWKRGYAPHTTTYLNGKLWETDPPDARVSPNGSKPEERRPSVPRFESIMHRYGKEGA
jgi:hypothetical protein